MSNFNSADIAAFKDVWVFCEQREGKLMPTDLELIFQKVMGVGRMPNAETEKLDPVKLQEAVAQVQAFVEDRMKTFLLSSNKI